MLTDEFKYHFQHCAVILQRSLIFIHYLTLDKNERTPISLHCNPFLASPWSNTSHPKRKSQAFQGSPQKNT
ncbi:hypothetical protein FGO68_gene13638 [Halteria grandinella]|uniref:Uncharacterized protein n=1 Tax=Halteria grandinella TaxID=5974 RepID=A0A8J8NZL3_HALGN|nr:hypothetical protein FGO68_gene13638 [Halteria grandinella]